MAGERNVLLLQRQRLAARNTQLKFDQIEARDGLRHRMLDLQPRVHFHEIVIARAIQQEFQRARALITDRFHRRDGGRTHPRAQLRRNCRRRRFLDQFLVTALHGAIPLAEMDRIAVTIAEHLNFDMARLNDGALQNDVRIAERILRLRARRA